GSVTSPPRSPYVLRLTVPSFHRQPRHIPRPSLLPPPQRDPCVSDFATSSKALRDIPPNRVRPPTDRGFASGCSPPHLAVTQGLSATEGWHTLTRTCTV